MASNELKRSLEKQDCVNLNWEIDMVSLNLVTSHDHLAVIHKPKFSLRNKLASTLIRGETKALRCSLVGAGGSRSSSRKKETKQDRTIANRTSAFRGSQHSDTPPSRGRIRKGVTPKTRIERTAYSRPQLTVRMETPSRSVKKLPGRRDLESRKQRAEVQHHVSARSIVEKTRKKWRKTPSPTTK